MRTEMSSNGSKNKQDLVGETLPSFFAWIIMIISTPYQILKRLCFFVNLPAFGLHFGHVFVHLIVSCFIITCHFEFIFFCHLLISISCLCLLSRPFSECTCVSCVCQLLCIKDFVFFLYSGLCLAPACHTCSPVLCCCLSPSFELFFFFFFFLLLALVDFCFVARVLITCFYGRFISVRLLIAVWIFCAVAYSSSLKLTFCSLTCLPECFPFGSSFVNTDISICFV